MKITTREITEVTIEHDCGASLVLRVAFEGGELKLLDRPETRKMLSDGPRGISGEKGISVVNRQPLPPEPPFQIVNRYSGAVISEGAYLPNAIENAPKNKMGGQNLYGATLTNANLFGVILKYADLECAILEGADLCCTNMEYANLEGANLQGAKINQYTILPQGFDWKAAGCIMT